MRNKKICLAPMLDWTDRHFRFLARLISRKTWLYSEMVTTGAILHGKDRERFLAFSPEEHPLALQLGGSEPSELAACTRIAAEWGYDEVNLNVGCPSDRVQSGRFGACLMAEPSLVADCLAAMHECDCVEVSIKTRIGIDHQDNYDQLQSLVAEVSKTGCKEFIIHARKAWLDGLSPKENREIPPLRYDFVYQLKQDFPELQIIINGGITTHEAIEEHLQYVDGVMIGREAYHNSWFLAQMDHRYFNEPASQQTRHQVAFKFTEYVEEQMTRGVPFHAMSRHILGLFHGCRGARQFRRILSENAHKVDAGPELLLKALELVEC